MVEPPPTSHGVARRRVSSAVKLPPFQKLIDAHGGDVHGFLIALVGPDAADDCYQDTWLAALRAYPRLRDAANLRGWVLTIAHRKAIDHTRRHRAVTPVAELPDRAGSPSALVDDDLWAHVRELPTKQRTALALRYLADAGYPEIAGVMGTTEDAARRSVHEGLKRLRTEYQR
jgi:RNA polymerase sigma factor (sigma-70 family)